MNVPVNINVKISETDTANRIEQLIWFFDSLNNTSGQLLQEIPPQKKKTERILRGKKGKEERQTSLSKKRGCFLAVSHSHYLKLMPPPLDLVNISHMKMPQTKHLDIIILLFK